MSGMPQSALCTAPTCSFRPKSSARGQPALKRLTVDELRDLFAKAYWQRFQVELAELLPVLVNLHTP